MFFKELVIKPSIYNNLSKKQEENETLIIIDVEENNPLQNNYNTDLINKKLMESNIEETDLKFISKILQPWLTTLKFNQKIDKFFFLILKSFLKNIISKTLQFNQNLLATSTENNNNNYRTHFPDKIITPMHVFNTIMFDEQFDFLLSFIK